MFYNLINVIMKDLDFWELLIWFLIIFGLIMFFLWIFVDVYLYLHCWGLPLNDELPFECFSQKWFYSVINN